MPEWDVFSADAFRLQTLTEMISRMPYVPSTLAQMGIFRERGLPTLTFSVDIKNRTLELVRTTARGAPIPVIPHNKGEVRSFRNEDRIAIQGRVTADEVQDRRRIGTESEMLNVMALVLERFEDMNRAMEATLEYQRLSALTGIVLDTDGVTPLWNWWTEFGVDPDLYDPTNWDLDNGSPANGVILNKCRTLRRDIVRSSGGLLPENAVIVGLCGDTFYDQLTTHSEVRDTYYNWQAATSLRANDGTFNIWAEFAFGNIRWVNYRSTDDGGATPALGLAPTECRFFPRAPGIFETGYMPHDSFAAVNRPGRRLFANTIPDRDRDAFRVLELLSYPIQVVRRPELLRRGINT